MEKYTNTKCGPKCKNNKKLDHMHVHLMHGAPVTHEWLVAAIGSEGTLFLFGLVLVSNGNGLNWKNA